MLTAGPLLLDRYAGALWAKSIVKCLETLPHSHLAGIERSHRTLFDGTFGKNSAFALSSSIPVSAPEYSSKIKGLHASACNPFVFLAPLSF
jgi:hypothetical protein